MASLAILLLSISSFFSGKRFSLCLCAMRYKSFATLLLVLSLRSAFPSFHTIDLLVLLIPLVLYRSFFCALGTWILRITSINSILYISSEIE